MDGKKDFINILSKTLTHSDLPNTNAATRPGGIVQNFSKRPTSNKKVSQRQTRTQTTRGSTQSKSDEHGKGGQVRRKNVYGLRKGRWGIPVAKQGQSDGVPRTPGHGFVRPGDDKGKGKGKGKGKHKPKHKSRGIASVYKSKNYKSKIFRKSSNGHSGRVSGTEFICNIQPPNSVRSTTGGVILERTISPLMEIASRMAQEAKMWQEYSVVSWKYIFTSACGTAVNGSIGIGVTDDPTMTLNEGGNTAIRKYETLDVHHEFNPFESKTVEFHGQKASNWLKVSPTEDPTLFMAGKVFFIVYSPLPSDGVVGSFGKIHLEYDVRFRAPFIQPGLIVDEPQILSTLTGSAIAANEGDWFALDTANFTTPPDPNTVYEVTIVSSWTEAGGVIFLGPTNDSYGVVPGSILYMKRDTKDNLWYFYEHQPDDSPSADDSVLIRTYMTPVSPVLAGGTVLYPMAKLQS